MERVLWKLSTHVCIVHIGPMKIIFDQGLGICYISFIILEITASNWEAIQVFSSTILSSFIRCFYCEKLAYLLRSSSDECSLKQVFYKCIEYIVTLNFIYKESTHGAIQIMKWIILFEDCTRLDICKIYDYKLREPILKI